MTAYTDRHRTDDPPLDEPREDWYFTFGFDHPQTGRFYVVHGATFMAARREMLKTYGNRWAFQYGVGDWFTDGVSQAERYGLEEITWRGVYERFCRDPEACRGRGTCPRDPSCSE